MAKIFLSAPITYVYQCALEKQESYIQVYKEVLKELRRRGHDVFFAAEQEEWGKVKLTAQETALRDLNELKQADRIIFLYLPKIHSSGVSTEMGWASLLKKPSVLILSKDRFLNLFEQGVLTFFPCITHKIDWTNPLEEIYGVFDKENI